MQTQVLIKTPTDERKYLYFFSKRKIQVDYKDKKEEVLLMRS